MSKKAFKLLARMRNSKKGWKAKDLIDLYTGFGFDLIHGNKHDIISHPKYRDMRTVLPRHDFLAIGYVEYAIKLIDKLLIIQKEENYEKPHK